MSLSENLNIWAIWGWSPLIIFSFEIGLHSIIKELGVVLWVSVIVICVEILFSFMFLQTVWISLFYWAINWIST